MSSTVMADDGYAKEQEAAPASPPRRGSLERPRRGIRETASGLYRLASHHMTKHAGAGIVASVAYFDPGNWSVDLAAGSLFGYKLLVVALAAGLGAVVLQVMAHKMGCVTGLNLAQHCRILLHDHPKHPRLVRWLCLYPLYVMSEVAIMSTDLAEMLGSAIALNMLFPRLPLWAGVVLTATDVVLILALNNDKGRPARIFEAIIISLVLAVLVSFIILLVKVHPNWPDVFRGYIPSRALFNPGALYSAIGILGATVMPHGLFLGSELATNDRVSSPQPASPLPPPATSSVHLWERSRMYITSLLNFPRKESAARSREGAVFHQNNSLEFIHAHLNHGIADIVMSLLGFAVFINSAILTLAATVFFFNGDNSPSMSDPAGLFDVHDLIKARLGPAAGIIFALALLCSGQSASLTATLSGQIVSEGFIEWRISPVLRRLITRLLGLVPATAIAAIVGRSGINTLLVISQVVLSVVLPFVTLPLVYLTSSPLIMGVKASQGPVQHDVGRDINPIDDTVNFGNGRVMQFLGYVIFFVVLVANAYVLVTLTMGAQT